MEETKERQERNKLKRDSGSLLEQTLKVQVKNIGPIDPLVLYSCYKSRSLINFPLKPSFLGPGRRPILFNFGGLFGLPKLEPWSLEPDASSPRHPAAQRSLALRLRRLRWCGPPPSGRHPTALPLPSASTSF